MALATTAFVDVFQWLILLENEFDKSLVDLDILLQRLQDSELNSDDDDSYEGHDKLAILSSVFAQLAQKAQTIFEANTRQEAHLIALKDDLQTALSQRDYAQSELKSYLLQLHLSQMQLQQRLGRGISVDNMRETLEQECERQRQQQMKHYRMKSAFEILEKENTDLKKYITALQNELYGTRLAAKYLEKELAGRIQQSQLLYRKLGKLETDPLWDTLESEIRLQRHKTVIRACRGRLSSAETAQFSDIKELGQCRQIVLFRTPNEGLGISVTGGVDYGVPIVISDVHKGQLAERTGGLFVGDTLLAVNGIRLMDKRHNEAVSILSHQQGKITLDVLLLPVKNEDAEEDGKVYTDETGYKFRLYDETKSLPSRFSFQLDETEQVSKSMSMSSVNTQTDLPCDNGDQTNGTEEKAQDNKYSAPKSSVPNTNSHSKDVVAEKLQELPETPSETCKHRPRKSKSVRISTASPECYEISDYDSPVVNMHSSLSHCFRPPVGLGYAKPLSDCPTADLSSNALQNSIQQDTEVAAL